MSDTLLRQWAMLRHVPRFPKKIGTPALHARLEEEGYSIDLRGVQRDLKTLSIAFPLVTDEHRPAGWSWKKDAPAFDVPGMDTHTAITYRLVEQQLGHYLPRTTFSALQPHFDLARGVLHRLRKEGLPRWTDKVVATVRGQPLLAPKVSPAVLAAVHDALLEERRLRVKYHRRGDGQTTEGDVNPLGLVYRDSLPYLVCTWWEYSDVRQLALPRVEKAELLEEKRRAPKGFDLVSYVASGATSFKMSSRPLRLVARFHPDAATSVVETPLAANQRVTVEASGWVKVEALLEDTRVLRGWLLSFGPMVEIVGPPTFRTAIAEAHREAAALYSRSRAHA